MPAGVSPGQVALAASAAGEFAVVRWVAPVAGRFRFTGTFFAGDTGMVSYTVRTNGVRSSYSGVTAGDYPINLDLVMMVNESVDFMVGEGWQNGDTPLAVSVTRLE